MLQRCSHFHFTGDNDVERLLVGEELGILPVAGMDLQWGGVWRGAGGECGREFNGERLLPVTATTSEMSDDASPRSSHVSEWRPVPASSTRLHEELVASSCSRSRSSIQRKSESVLGLGDMASLVKFDKVA